MNQTENSQNLNLKYKLIARGLFNEKNYEEALKYYRLSIQYNESDHLAQLQYIMKCLARLGQFEELQKEYEEYYKSHQEDIILFNLVLLNCQLLQFDKAEEYDKKYKNEHISIIQIESKVILYFYSRKYKEAEDELKKIGDEYLDDFMLYILCQIQYITKKDQISKQYLKNQQLHIILKAIIEFNDLPYHIIQEQLQYDKIRQQFYQDIKQKQINPQYFEIKRYAYFEPFEQEFLLRQSQTWASTISKQIQFFHNSMGNLTLAQQKFLVIYNNKKYQTYFSDMTMVFNQFTNISQQLKELIQYTELDNKQLEYVKIIFSTLEHQSLTEIEIIEIIKGIDESLEERIQFISDQYESENLENEELIKNYQETKQDNNKFNQSEEMLYKIRQGTIDSYFILFMRQRNRLELNKAIVRDFIILSLVKIIKGQ